jgi:hypothetical protein
VVYFLRIPIQYNSKKELTCFVSWREEFVDIKDASGLEKIIGKGEDANIEYDLESSAFSLSQVVKDCLVYSISPNLLYC